MSSPSSESRRILGNLSTRLKILDTLWTMGNNRAMASNAAMYIVILAIVDQGGTHLSPAFLIEVARKDSKDVFSLGSCPHRITLCWKDVLDVLQKHAPRTIPLVAHVDERSEVKNVSLTEAVGWLLGLVFGKSDDEAAHSRTQHHRAPENSVST